MKVLLPYFVEFQKDGTILFKEYLDNCIDDGLDQQSIIMITNYKNTFSANNSRGKVWTLEKHRILCPKGIKKV